MMWYPGSEMNGWVWGLSIATAIIFWALVIWLAVQITDWSRRDRRS